MTSECCECLSTTRSLVAYSSLPRGKAFPKLTGIRCMSCWRVRRTQAKAKRQEAYVQLKYGLKPGEYAALYELQGARCAICRRATGATKRLAVDHDHRDGAPRGLLCGPCNSMLGHARDELEFFQRALDYLLKTPYARLNEERNEGGHHER